MRLLFVFLTIPALAHAMVLSPASGRCEKAAASSLSSCVRKLGKLVRACYLETGAPCPESAPPIAALFAGIAQKVQARCSDDATVQSAGYGPNLTRDALAERIVVACRSEHAALAARLFGGPQGAVLAAANATGRACLTAAHRESTKALVDTTKAWSTCIRKNHTPPGDGCNTGTLATRLALASNRVHERVALACPTLPALIGINAETFRDRLAAQGGCLSAAAHGPDTGPLGTSERRCGARADVPVPPRDTWVQITLDESVWGTRCGDGSPYAFWLRLAPVGAPLERLAIDLAGGGVCIFESDCLGVNADLYQAADDPAPTTGYMSTSAATNPFHDWSMVYLPYCTQDVHFGGGLTSAFPGITVHRYGARNMRATLQYVRDVLWAALDAETAEGYRPDRMRVLFAGESAGAFGVSYNYHWVVDDLGWSHTTGAPDSGLALDNHQPIGVAALGLILTGTASPLGWGTLPYQPPYCLDTTCGLVPEVQARTAARLKAVPEQQILNLSNQVDSTQVSTTFFSSTVAWIDELRSSYCANKDLPGIHYFLPANTSSIHTMLRTNSRFTGLLAGGVSPRDWLAAAIADPDGVPDLADEGTLVGAYGAQPIPCAP